MRLLRSVAAVCLAALVTVAAQAADLEHPVPPPPVPAHAAFGLVPSIWYDGGAPYVAEGPVAGHPRPAIIVTKPQVVAVPRTNTSYPEQLYTALTTSPSPLVAIPVTPLTRRIDTPYGPRPLTTAVPTNTCTALPDGRLFCN